MLLQAMAANFIIAYFAHRWVDPVGAIVISLYIVWRWVVICKGQVRALSWLPVLGCCAEHCRFVAPTLLRSFTRCPCARELVEVHLNALQNSLRVGLYQCSTLPAPIIDCLPPQGQVVGQGRAGGPCAGARDIGQTPPRLSFLDS